ncbi:hypothetical protein [Paenibacillus sp. FSL P4-0288]|uniref:hypothetical protein n=1 Tax=Paenibacillus sp. FSL P4-0288 TaxID=2921633 RepID=UPI0030F961FA
MNKNQKIVVEWLSNSQLNFMDNLVELDGCFESIPDDVGCAYEELSEKEKIEVVKKSASNLLAKTTA